MKNKSYIGVAFIILIFGIYAVPKIVDNFKKVELHTFSKVPNFEFVDQHNKTVTNQTYNGKVYVLEFFFTTCPTICPIMNKKMIEVQNEFFGNPNFGVASVSINPDYDTPEVLNAYAKEYGVNSPNWHMLTGKPKEVVYDLSNNGFKLFAGIAGEEVGGFEHSGLFALVDKNGYIRSRYDKDGNPIMYYRALKENEFEDQIKELKEDIKILLNE
ncbi:SCO family protein [Urechidicola vernalis]|uniref:SCO family protein n=1 Tax=Urechidicola vernalis TaxID=3075600 RepID=A0ABU2Y8C4_9FLAO|nr:SCO family protein [Urechidicola sp. P050]MDT0554055.1 SCO family protein [Urechidicola sp. P050]